MPMKKEMSMGGTCKCQHHKIFGWVFLIVGILYLIKDFGGWDFWGIQWYTVLFLLIGLGALCMCCDNKKWC